MAEIHVVGALPIVEAVLADCLTRGARAAAPGEFTLRAFLAGRIDLTRAEAVLGVIEAENRTQLDAALHQLAGGIAGPIASLRDRLLDVLAHLEANLDFTEEPDVDPLGRAALAEELARAARDVSDLAGRLLTRDRPDAAPRVVLVGAPNVGKSRLFNALLGRARALVADRAGTTRDHLTAVCRCDGLDIQLVDTAGSDDPADDVEAQAQALRIAQIEAADLLLVCRCPAAAPPTLRAEGTYDRILVWTKSDEQPPPSTAWFATSAATGEGLPALRSEIARVLLGRADTGSSAGPSARCREALARAGDALSAAADAVRIGVPDDLLALDLRVALDELGKVVGAVITDDILDRIFARFCIGK